MDSEIILYQNPDGNIKIDVSLEEETVWLSQVQLCELLTHAGKISHEAPYRNQPMSLRNISWLKILLKKN